MTEKEAYDPEGTNRIPPPPALPAEKQRSRRPLSVTIIAVGTFLIALFWLKNCLQTIFEGIPSSSEMPFSLWIFTFGLQVLMLFLYSWIGLGLLNLAAWARKGMIILAIITLSIVATGIFLLIGEPIHRIQPAMIAILALPTIIYIPTLVVLSRPEIKALFSKSQQG